LDYYITTSVARPFDGVVAEVIERLKAEDLDVLYDVDLAAALQANAGVRIPCYRILGACNATLAREALELQSPLGVLLPCHVVVREAADDCVSVASVDPVAAIDRSGSTALARIALEVRKRLTRVVAGIAN
jgi:uncharacterized protein (DUF302 family)